MKKSLMMLAAIVCYVMTTAVFTACTKVDDPEPIPIHSEPETLAEYTIMYYGFGGGNLDNIYVQKIGNFYKAAPEAFKKVNVVVQYKFSTAANLEKQGLTEEACNYYGSKTFRLAVDPDDFILDQMREEGFYGADNADVACPDSLTHFINWAAEAYPAKKYMLIVNDHGGGYVPDDELPETISATTRGILYDDGNFTPAQKKNHFTAKSLHRAVDAANVRIEIFYVEACLMNTLEYQFELQDLCDYTIASTYSKPSIEGAYEALPNLLSQSSLDIEQALDKYCKASVESWDLGIGFDEAIPRYTDLTVTRTANISHLGEVLREFIDRLCDTYANGTDAQRQAINKCTAKAVKVDADRPSYDAVKYVKSIINALPEVYGEAFNNRMKEAFNNCILAQYYSKYLTNHEFMVDYSVLLGAKGAYAYTIWEIQEETGLLTLTHERIHFYDGDYQYYSVSVSKDNPSIIRLEPTGKVLYWGSTMADTYEQLAFDRAVGWSRWLKLNQQWPKLFSEAGFQAPLPMPEDDNGQN